MPQTWYVFVQETAGLYNLFRGGYAQAHDDPNATVVAPMYTFGGGLTPLEIGQADVGGFSVQRGGMAFDTSCLPPAMLPIVGADMLWFSSAWPISYDPLDFQDIHIVDGSPLALPFVAHHYGDLITSVVDFGKQHLILAFPTGYNWVPVPLNALGIAAINPAGLTFFGLRNTRDIANIAPGFLNYYSIQVSSPKQDDIVGAYQWSLSGITFAGIGYHSVDATAQITNLFPTDLGGSTTPSALRIVGAGAGSFSNIDVRMRIYPDLLAGPFSYGAWQSNWPPYTPWTETFGGLTQGTTYSVDMQWRYHGSATIHVSNPTRWTFNTLPYTAPTVQTDPAVVS
jgi:hypothetical protein